MKEYKEKMKKKIYKLFIQLLNNIITMLLFSVNGKTYFLNSTTKYFYLYIYILYLDKKICLV